MKLLEKLFGKKGVEPEKISKEKIEIAKKMRLPANEAEYEARKAEIERRLKEKRKKRRK